MLDAKQPYDRANDDSASGNALVEEAFQELREKRQEWYDAMDLAPNDFGSMIRGGPSVMANRNIAHDGAMGDRLALRREGMVSAIRVVAFSLRMHTDLFSRILCAAWIERVQC